MPALSGVSPDHDRVSADQAAQTALQYYGIDGTAQRLAAEFDDTFRLTAADGSSWLLKIGATRPPRPPAGHAAHGGVSLETAILLHLASAAPRLPVQRVIFALDGRPEVRWVDSGQPRLVRMTSWLDGGLLGRDGSTTGLRRDLGSVLGRLNRALRGFSHPGASRTHQWDLQRFGALEPLLAELTLDDALRAALSGCLSRFGAEVAPRLGTARSQVIHADFHGENLLADGTRVTGILDFGDALSGPVAMDVGIAACYQLGHGADPLAPALDVVAGYHAADPLSPGELDLVGEFILARVATRIIVSRWNAIREPANRGYLLRRTPQAIGQFEALRRLAPDEVAGRLRTACGM
ncbi:MAG TPA: phosphotransferase [Trebonia sp.]